MTPQSFPRGESLSRTWARSGAVSMSLVTHEKLLCSEDELRIQWETQMRMDTFQIKGRDPVSRGQKLLIEI